MKILKFLLPLLIIVSCLTIINTYGEKILNKIKYYKLSKVRLDTKSILTNLPLVIICTQDKIIDEAKIQAQMKIIFKENSLNHPLDSGNIYNGQIGIELRGKSSLSWPQKSYAFETRDNIGNKRNVSILNMPEENDWILLATFNDRQFMENSLAYHLFEKMGHYAPRANLCEVIINNDYKGLYLLTEKIKIDKNRVNISKINRKDNLGDDLTGGYIFLVDYYSSGNSWESNYYSVDRNSEKAHFVYYYPKPNNITFEQKNYLKNYIDRVENSLQSVTSDNNYKSYIDIESFIDYFIISELSHNRDAYKKSCYYYKNRNSIDSLLHSGPVWDFDYAWLEDPTGWVHQINKENGYPVAPDWINNLLKNDDFRLELFNRYNKFRKTILSREYLNSYIDSVYFLVENAQKRHYQRWPILEYASELGETQAFDNLINQFKEQICLRLDWLDKNIPGNELINKKN